MYIIGHRGAAGLELENTLASIQLALNLKVKAIEVDVRKTKDGHLVLCHDADLIRVAGLNKKIGDLTLRQLQKIPLLTGTHVPSLEEALELIGQVPLFIELKETDSLSALTTSIDKFPNANLSIASFKLDELVKLRELKPEINLFLLERTKPLEVIHSARRQKLSGVGLNYWLLNPLTYFLCKRAGLQIYVFTVDKKILGKMIGWLYPKVWICTNYPTYFVKNKNNSKI